MRVFMLGASGLVGSSCYSKLLIQKELGQLVSFSRRRLQLTGATERVSDLKDFTPLMQDLEGDVALCAVGTTMKKAKTKANFEEIDLHLPLRFALAAKAHGCKSFHLVSTLGADASSKQFYLHIKGTLENELKTLGFDALHIYRPSLLMGMREDFRLGEELLAGFYRRFKTFYPHALDKYRPIDVDRLSHFIVRKMQVYHKGIHVWENQEMLEG